MHKLILRVLFIGFFLFGLTSAFADIDLKQKEIQDLDEVTERHMKRLSDAGLNLLPKGVHIVLRTQFNREMSQSMIRIGLQAQQEVKKFGYIARAEPRVHELLMLHETSEYQYKKFAGTDDPTGTYLRHTIPEIKLAFTFRGVPDRATAS